MRVREKTDDSLPETSTDQAVLHQRSREECTAQDEYPHDQNPKGDEIFHDGSGPDELPAMTESGQNCVGEDVGRNQSLSINENKNVYVAGDESQEHQENLSHNVKVDARISDHEEEIDSTGTYDDRHNVSRTSNDMSRLFTSYRSVGLITDGRPFYLLPNQNSGSALLCLPIGQRFHILRCDKLQAVLVSQNVPAPSISRRHCDTIRPVEQISQLISDTNLSVTVVAHGVHGKPQHLTLYNRNTPLQTVCVVPQTQNGFNDEWKIIDLLHLGRMQVAMKGREKCGRKENAVIVAAVLKKDRTILDTREDTNVLNSTQNRDMRGGAAVLGDSDSERSDNESGQTEDPMDRYRCRVVILLATRESIGVHKEIPITTHPTFVPRVAVHPFTYVNKIVLGGSQTCWRDEGKRSKRPAPAMLLINIRSGKVLHEFSCLSSTQLKNNQDASTSVTALEQSPAVDTIAVGTSHGMVHLINLKFDRSLFSLAHKSRDDISSKVRNSSKNPHTDFFSTAVSITSISFRSDASAMNYGVAPMAVGRSDGNITVWDLNPPDRGDEDRLDIGRSRKDGTILCEMIQVHPYGISKIMFMPQEPLLLSIGMKSNSVLMHIFDNPDHSGRILRQRRGHTSAPTRIRYLHPGAAGGGGILASMVDGTDASACQVLSSGGSDRMLRVFSTARSAVDKEYSQRKGLSKKAKKLGMDSSTDLLLPPLTGLAICEARSRDWGDLVTIHLQHSFAYVWSTKRGAQWGPVLRQPRWNVSGMKGAPPPSTHATSVAMSACGNFAVVGTLGGTIYKYNVQSGNARGSYPRDAGDDKSCGRRKLQPGDVKRTTKALEKRMKISNRATNLDKVDKDSIEEALIEQRRQTKLKVACHTGFIVTGLAVDSTNTTMLSVGSDAKLVLWNFASHAPHKKSPCKLPSPATMLCHIRDSDLAAIALEDFSTLLFDCTSLSIVRRFGKKRSGHNGPICDLAFSPNGRSLYTASLDSTIRVWDVPTNKCIDWLSFDSPPTSLTVSPTGEFLATSHANKLGLSIWSDKTYYQRVSIDGAKELSKPFCMDQPNPIAEVTEIFGENSKDSIQTPREAVQSTSDKDEPENWDAKLSATAKQRGLVTLSNLPPAHWKNLFHLELIKERNKPKEPPKKPPSAPFFLQWRGGEPLANPPSGPSEYTTKKKNISNNNSIDDYDSWNAAWSDDDDDDDNAYDNGVKLTDDEVLADIIKRKREDPQKADRLNDCGDQDVTPPENENCVERAAKSRIIRGSKTTKKRKICHHRSHLATLLARCSWNPITAPGVGPATRRFQSVTDHIVSLGPSAIDVSLSSLCNGMQDLEDGLPLLQLACEWLIEAFESREMYEAVNAYLHRFLHIHSTVIAGVEDKELRDSQQEQNKVLSTSQNKKLNESEGEKIAGAAKEKLDEQREQLLERVSELRRAQQSASDILRDKLQITLCLLRHFSRMV